MVAESRVKCGQLEEGCQVVPRDLIWVTPIAAREDQVRPHHLAGAVNSRQVAMQVAHDENAHHHK